MLKLSFTLKEIFRILLVHCLLLFAGVQAYSQDTDGDGTANATDLDDDNDGLTDEQEAFLLLTNYRPPCGTASTPNFTAPATLITGTAKTAGAVYRIANVLTGTDALIEIELLQNTTDITIDDNSTGRAASFQPITSINNLSLNQEAFAQYKITFVNSGTTTPVKLASMYANIADIDGNATQIGDVVYFSDHVSYTTQGTSNITVVNSVYNANVNWTKATAGTAEVDNIDTLNKAAMITPRFANFSSFRIRVGVFSRQNNGIATNRGSRIDFTCVAQYTNPSTHVIDFDEDGLVNTVDLDSDNDGIADATETAAAKTDLDGNPDFMDSDADGDGISDLIEGQTTAGFKPLTNQDTDRDGMDNAFDDKAGFGLTVIPVPTNSDGKDLPDYQDLDSDNDVQTDVLEGWDANNDGTADVQTSGKDGDRDGLDDAFDSNDFIFNPGNGQTPISFPNTAGGSERDWREPYIDKPLAQVDQLEATEDVPLPLNAIFNNDIISDDGPSATAGFTVTVPPAHGSISIDFNGTPDNTSDDKYIFTPTLNYNGPDSFIYQTCDATDDCDTAQVKLTIAAVNDSPLTKDEVASTDPSVSVLVNVKNKVSDVDSNTVFTFTIISNPAGTTANVDPQTGIITYTPTSENNRRQDTIVYSACDNGNPKLCANGRLLVTVPDIVIALEDVPEVIKVTNSNSDISSVAVLDNPKNGAVAINTLTGDLTYTSKLNFNGLDSLRYKVCGKTSPCDTSWILISVAPVNDAPILKDAFASTDPSVAVSVNTSGNVSDVDVNSIFTFKIISAPQGTSANIDATTGILSYTPGASRTRRQDTIVYSACDNGAPQLCTNALVLVTVPNIILTLEDTQAQIKIANSASDITTASLLDNPKNGTATLAPNSGEVLYTPTLNFFGEDSLRFRICEKSGDCDTSWIKISVISVNDVPVVDADSITINEDTEGTGDLTNAGDSDIEETVLLTPEIMQKPKHGTLSISQDGNFVYLPDLNFNGRDTALVSVCDQGLPLPKQCVNNPLYILIKPINDAPVADDILANADPAIPTKIVLAGHSTDPDTGTVYTYTILVHPSGTTATFDQTTGTLTYASLPDPSTRTDIVSYQVCDNAQPSLCSNANVLIAVPDRSFRAKNDSGSMDEDNNSTVYVLVNDTAFHKVDTSRLAINLPPKHGKAIVDYKKGTIVYTPDLNYFGNDSLTYNICTSGKAVECKTAQVSYTINPLNDLEVKSDPFIAGIGDEPVRSNFIANDIDPENTGITAGRLVKGPDHGNFDYSPNGDFVYTPAVTAPSVVETVVVEVCDKGLPLPGLCKNDTLLFSIKQYLFISEGFTPNGDGQNDFFIVETLIEGSIDLKMFNRWGGLVYSNPNYNNTWDGRSNEGIRVGETLPEGTYFYEIKFGNNQVKRNYITILK